jgi:hypothetical protein
MALADVEHECLNIAAARIPPVRPKTNEVTLIPGMVIVKAFIRCPSRIFGAGVSNGSVANRLNRGFVRLCGNDMIYKVM